MSITIKIGEEEKDKITLELNARKSIDGNIMIFDHKDIDIVIIPEDKKIITFPKESMHDDIYDAQDRLFKFLQKKGVILPESVEGGDVYASLQAEYPEAVGGADATQLALFSVGKWVSEEKPEMDMEEYYNKSLENWYTQPDDESSTELGEVPASEKKGSLDVGRIRNYMSGYGFR